jgi:putative transposase
MARLARVVATDLPHHVTQRGNARQVIFGSDGDRLVYLQLLESNCQFHGLSMLGFCLMSNHVHLVVVPQRAEALGLALRHAHDRYASYVNARRGTSGHVWQGRYYSCPLDTEHLWAALRYTECNPVRAGMVQMPDAYRWSSAALHCGQAVGPLPLSVDVESWQRSWSAATWRQFLGQADADQVNEVLRTSRHTLHPSLAPRKGGRPRKQNNDPGQTASSFS